MGSASVGLAKTLMRLRPTYPDPSDASLGEVFNRREFTTASAAEQHQYMLRVAESRYRTEQEVPYRTYFRGLDLAPYLRDRRVLDFGCSTAGLARSIVETYRPRTLVGVEIDPLRIRAAGAHFRARGLPIRWVHGDGQQLPFQDASFDTIYSFDVFEHVPDLARAVRERARILAPGGRVLAVFPGFYHWTEHHLSLVSLTPFVHYFFSPRTLSAAYEEILDARGADAYWYRRSAPGFEPWERSYSINGTTRRAFSRMVRAAGLDVEHDCRLVLGETGRLRRRLPVLGALVPLIKSMARLPLMDEFLLHRIVMVLQKPAGGATH